MVLSSHNDFRSHLLKTKTCTVEKTEISDTSATYIQKIRDSIIMSSGQNIIFLHENLVRAGEN